MSKNKELEAYRATLQSAADEDSDTAIHYYLKAAAMREGTDAKTRLYAKYCPVHHLSQDDLCQRMELHNRKYSAGEYRMILEEAIEAIAYELHSGNTVTLPKLGHFSLGIGGAFDPADRPEFRKHPIRAQLRFAQSFNDSLNKGAKLKRLRGEENSEQ